VCAIYFSTAKVFCVEVIPTALHALRGIDYMVQAKLAEGRAQEAEQKLRGTNVSEPLRATE
jgi:hypothetical protein